MTLEAHQESDQKVLDEASLRNYNNSSRRFSDQPDFVLGQPLKVSWEIVEEMTFGFRTRILADEKSDYSVYEGFWEPVYGSQVMVMRYNTTACTSTSPGNSRGVLEAEKKAALSMHHKNILSLAGYCNCDNTMILIFPSAKRGSLETNLYGKHLILTFQDRLKIAIEIARGVRYMHEECPQGPIVHGELLISNIFLQRDLRPLISGFGKATWLHLKQLSKSIPNQKFSLRDYIDLESCVRLKSDIFSYGILLLRLFCKTSVPRDDKTLIEWARPLLMKGAFHELLDEKWDVDIHEMYRVMYTASQCTETSPDSRPCISELNATRAPRHPVCVIYVLGLKYRHTLGSVFENESHIDGRRDFAWAYEF